jgi:hypothetical protein
MIKHNLKNQQKHQFRSTICEPRTWPARVSSHEPSWHSAVQPSTLQAGPLAAWGQFLNRTAFLPPRHPLNPHPPQKNSSPPSLVRCLLGPFSGPPVQKFPPLPPAQTHGILPTPAPRLTLRPAACGISAHGDRARSELLVLLHRRRAAAGREEGPPHRQLERRGACVPRGRVRVCVSEPASQFADFFC